MRPSWGSGRCCACGSTRERSLGALDLYSDTPGAFGPDDREQVLALAAHAAAALAAAHEIDQLHTGMERRTVLGQATGILMERYAISADVAFEVLRRTSQDQNRKVHDIAGELVTGGRSEGL